MRITRREKKFWEQHLSCVRHITLDPKGPGRSGRLRAFLLGLGLLDGQIDFPLRGDGEDLHGDLLPLGEVVVDVADKGSGHL